MVVDNPQCCVSMSDISNAIIELLKRMKQGIDVTKTGFLMLENWIFNVKTGFLM